MAKKRTEKEILADLDEARNKYASLASDKKSSVGETETAAKKVAMLTRELSEYVSTGAKKCAECGNEPMGMLKTPAHVDKGMDIPNAFEVGCVFCPPYLIEHQEGTELKIDGKKKKVKRRSFSARAFSPEEAVRKWNEGEWVEDFYFDRIPGFIPEPV